MAIQSLSKKSLAIAFFCIAFITQLSISLASANEKVLQLNPNENRYQLGSYLQILEDTSGKLTIADVSSGKFSDKFITNDSTSINKGFSDAFLWIRFSLLPVTAPAKPAVVGNTVSYAEWLLHFGKHFDLSIEVIYEKMLNRIGEEQQLILYRSVS